MRAAICTAPGSIAVAAAPVPQPAPDEVVIRVAACGICGSDVHWFCGQVAPPAVCPGHEFAGEVVGCGAAVAGIAPGDRVAAEPMVVCGRCAYCRSARPQLCRSLRIIGVHRPGGFAEYVAVPAAAVFPLPPDLDSAVAALAEPTAVAVHGVRLGGVTRGARVLVLGAGSIGLLAALAARAAGGDVTITARHAHQAAAARRLGAAPVGEHALDPRARFDVVIETVGGQADTLVTALRMVLRAGTVVILGVFTLAPALPALALVSKEVRVVGSLMYDRAGPRPDFAVALELLDRERTAVAGLITHRIPLADVQTAFATAADKRTGAIKVSVLP
jgi:L-iditol 2-dehydrogenase